MIQGGIVLAAGASERMGRPKALLEIDGEPLAARQADLLRKAGCDRVTVVLGADAIRIRTALAKTPTTINPDWQTGGRFSSIQRGLRALPECEGYFILPVDTAGVSLETFRAMRLDIVRFHPPALRPTYKGNRGKLLWISRGMGTNILATPPKSAGTVRLDHLLRDIERLVPVDDPAILNNLNTPEDWERFRSGA